MIHEPTARQRASCTKFLQPTVVWRARRHRNCFLANTHKTLNTKFWAHRTAFRSFRLWVLLIVSCHVYSSVYPVALVRRPCFFCCFLQCHILPLRFQKTMFNFLGFDTNLWECFCSLRLIVFCTLLKPWFGEGEGVGRGDKEVDDGEDCRETDKGDLWISPKHIAVAYTRFFTSGGHSKGTIRSLFFCWNAHFALMEVESDFCWRG